MVHLENIESRKTSELIHTYMINQGWVYRSSSAELSLQEPVTINPEDEEGYLKGETPEPISSHTEEIIENYINGIRFSVENLLHMLGGRLYIQGLAAAKNKSMKDFKPEDIPTDLNFDKLARNAAKAWGANNLKDFAIGDRDPEIFDQAANINNYLLFLIIEIYEQYSIENPKHDLNDFKGSATGWPLILEVITGLQEEYSISEETVIALERGVSSAFQSYLYVRNELSTHSSWEKQNINNVNIVNVRLPSPEQESNAIDMVVELELEIDGQMVTREMYVQSKSLPNIPEMEPFLMFAELSLAEYSETQSIIIQQGRFRKYITRLAPDLPPQRVKPLVDSDYKRLANACLDNNSLLLFTFDDPKLFVQ